MLTSITVPLAATLAWATLIVTAGPASADEDPVQVTPGGYGVVDTRVTDPGRSGAVEKVAQRRDQPTGSAKPARTCTSRTSPMVGKIDAGDTIEWGGAPRPGPGGWIVRECSDGTIDAGWVIEGDAEAADAEPAVTPEQLALQATNRLRLPLGEPRFNPNRDSSAGPSTMVAIPTWFWAEDVEPVSQRTSAGAVWARVTASPVSMTVDPGDGSAPIRCTGTGTAWKPGAAETECTYTYRRSSAAQPGNVYTATATVQWRVTWEGPGGLGGTLPLMERQTTFPIAVTERQTVVTTTGGGA